MNKLLINAYGYNFSNKELYLITGISWIGNWDLLTKETVAALEDLSIFYSGELKKFTNSDGRSFIAFAFSTVEDCLAYRLKHSDIQWQ